jgi:hypothetical protein
MQLLEPSACSAWCALAHDPILRSNSCRRTFIHSQLYSVLSSFIHGRYSRTHWSLFSASVRTPTYFIYPRSDFTSKRSHDRHSIIEFCKLVQEDPVRFMRKALVLIFLNLFESCSFIQPYFFGVSSVSPRCVLHYFYLSQLSLLLQTNAPLTMRNNRLLLKLHCPSILFMQRNPVRLGAGYEPCPAIFIRGHDSDAPVGG